MNTRCHTFTGTGFDPFAPKAEDVRLEDIAHQLAMMCRFGGACPVFYSVAEHSIRVARVVEALSGNPKWALSALHHDSAEAYIGDVRRPIKSAILVAVDRDSLVGFQSFEAEVHQAVSEALRLPVYSTDEDRLEANLVISHADDLMLSFEFAALFGQPKPEWNFSKEVTEAVKILPEKAWSWRDAKIAFLLEHRRLSDAVGALYGGASAVDPSPTAWLPIEIAPKSEEEPILVLGTHGGFETFGDESFKEFQRVTVAVWDKSINDWSFDDDAFVGPTHWMPLPAAPKLDGKAGA